MSTKEISCRQKGKRWYRYARCRRWRLRAATRDECRRHNSAELEDWSCSCHLSFAPLPPFCVFVPSFSALVLRCLCRIRTGIVAGTRHSRRCVLGSGRLGRRLYSAMSHWCVHPAGGSIYTSTSYSGILFHGMAGGAKTKHDLLPTFPSPLGQDTGCSCQSCANLPNTARSMSIPHR